MVSICYWVYTPYVPYIVTSAIFVIFALFATFHRFVVYSLLKLHGLPTIQQFLGALGQASVSFGWHDLYHTLHGGCLGHQGHGGLIILDTVCITSWHGQQLLQHMCVGGYGAHQ